jgi:hypothetical protein
MTLTPEPLAQLREAIEERCRAAQLVGNLAVAGPYRPFEDARAGLRCFEVALESALTAAEAEVAALRAERDDMIHELKAVCREVGNDEDTYRGVAAGVRMTMCHYDELKERLAALAGKGGTDA